MKKKWFLSASHIGYSLIVPVLMLFLSMSVSAEVTLPYVLSDNMVLQRDIPVNIWGWANAGERVTVTFNGQTMSAKTTKSGTWKIQLKPVAAGGPYEMTVKGKNSIVLKNILAGDVWVCGGQSVASRACGGNKKFFGEGEEFVTDRPRGCAPRRG
jgi:hypothetical protein